MLYNYFKIGLCLYGDCVLLVQALDGMIYSAKSQNPKSTWIYKLKNCDFIEKLLQLEDACVQSPYGQKVIKQYAFSALTILPNLQILNGYQESAGCILLGNC